MKNPIYNYYLGANVKRTEACTQIERIIATTEDYNMRVKSSGELDRFCKVRLSRNTATLPLCVEIQWLYCYYGRVDTDFTVNYTIWICGSAAHRDGFIPSIRYGVLPSQVRVCKRPPWVCGVLLGGCPGKWHHLNLGKLGRRSGG